MCPPVPVSEPNVHMSPRSPVVEDMDNVTWTCSVDRGSRVQYRWFRDGIPVGTGDRYSFSGNNGKFGISPVRKEDIGEYVCQVSNHVSEEWSRAVPLSVFCKYTVTCLQLLNILLQDRSFFRQIRNTISHKNNYA